MTTIRMYNVGLGDCFLIRFDAPDRPRYLLIDCGLFRGSDAERATLTAVANDIAQTTGGHIDVVVATHEHQDHLSGFAYAQDVFSTITFGKVWLAWTEKPGDPMAERLRTTRQAFTDKLEDAVTRLKKDTQRAFNLVALEAVESVMEFAGFDGLAATTRVGVNKQALQFLNKPGLADYQEPGMILSIDTLENVRVYVLGPPRSDLILRSDPSKKTPEVYNFAGNTRSTFGMDIPSWDGSNEDAERLDTLPFEKSYQLSIDEAKQDPFFCQYYWNENDEHDQSQVYRRIDNDWVFGLGNLALQLDGDTNNTSLALAIELTESGKVLLFPGDAQVGNWLSWDSCTFPDGVKAADLLARTVFYKVGHHGSHNATLRELGLERMVSPELTAMIPVDRHFAQNKKHWEMPFEKLHERLKQKTRERILFADSRFPHEPGAGSTPPKALSPDEWVAFKNRVRFSENLRPSTDESTKDRPLWVEIDM